MSMTPNNPPATQAPGMGVSTMRRVAVVLVPAIAAALAVSRFSGWRYGLLTGWMVGAAAFVGWTLLTVWPMNADQTAAHARRDDPGRGTLDVLVLGAAVASLGAVAILLLDKADNSALDAALSVGSIGLAWLSVHTVYTTRYAGLYYAGRPGGIDFNEDDPPQYSDFAYLAFTLGMTFQVSDTDLQTKPIRQTALRHALLSFLFVAIILAATINLVAGLAN
jgi:uncharacterized membrane protein